MLGFLAESTQSTSKDKHIPHPDSLFQYKVKPAIVIQMCMSKERVLVASLAGRPRKINPQPMKRLANNTFTEVRLIFN